MRLTPDQRHLLNEAVGRRINKSLVATVFGVTSKTVRKWSKRAKQLKDKARGKISKITDTVKLFIIAVRNTFKWGTARIRNALMSELPPFMEEKLKDLGVARPESVKLSRSTINEILKEFNLNGYKKKHKKWKFFRASRPLELFQLDMKGPYMVQGKKFWWLVCLDDFSRVAIHAKKYDHAPSHKEIWESLLPNLKDRIPERMGQAMPKSWNKLTAHPPLLAQRQWKNRTNDQNTF